MSSLGCCREGRGRAALGLSRLAFTMKAIDRDVIVRQQSDCIRRHSSGTFPTVRRGLSNCHQQPSEQGGLGLQAVNSALDNFLIRILTCILTCIRILTCTFELRTAILTWYNTVRIQFGA